MSYFYILNKFGMKMQEQFCTREIKMRFLQLIRWITTYSITMFMNNMLFIHWNCLGISYWLWYWLCRCLPMSVPGIGWELWWHFIRGAQSTEKIQLENSAAMAPSKNHDPLTENNPQTLLWAVSCRDFIVSFLLNYSQQQTLLTIQ